MKISYQINQNGKTKSDDNRIKGNGGIKPKGTNRELRLNFGLCL
jgi:hypothetical protein